MIRHRFEAYLDKVFGFSDLVKALPEGRQFPQPPGKEVLAAVFLGAAMQIPSLLQIEAECHDGALAARSRRCSSISSAAAAGESTPKFFRPSPPTATSNTLRSTKPRPWWCSR